MTDRIGEMFARQKQAGKKALITFVTAGDPDIATTEELVLAMEKSGANLVELGIPFSDPVAEGPVIQAANIRALSNGLKIDGVFGAVEHLRDKTQVPLVFLMYINCIFNYGKDRFFKRCRETGVDGVIIPDLPYEEKGEVSAQAAEYGIKLISLVAPTSHARIQKIAEQAEGFLYCVSSLGVTGTRSSFKTDFETFFSLINQYTAAPTALGFGISSPEQARELKQYADGIIVGSAIVRLVGAAATPEEAVQSVTDFTASLREGLDT
ncbi:MAG: tryptophan synthase subunit alpha [Ethanoligenens sp.]